MKEATDYSDNDLLKTYYYLYIWWIGHTFYTVNLKTLILNNNFIWDEMNSHLLPHEFILITYLDLMK